MKEIKFSLVFRDMWQSAGKYVPRVDQLVAIAPTIIDMGCFARVETNGGGFEQVNLLFGENPNKAVREWTKPFHEAGIETHMLDRGLNGIRMSPVPSDVRKLFYKVKKAQGTDITRTFCGLNDVRNIAPSIAYAHEAGMISQCSLCITSSPIHTVEYYVNMAKELIDLDEFKESMKGIYSTSVGTGTIDESPMAYKDPKEILQLIADTVEVEYFIKPVNLSCK